MVSKPITYADFFERLLLPESKTSLAFINPKKEIQIIWFGCEVVNMKEKKSINTLVVKKEGNEDEMFDVFLEIVPYFSTGISSIPTDLLAEMRNLITAKKAKDLLLSKV